MPFQAQQSKRSGRIAFGSNFAINYDPDKWATEDADAPPSTPSLSFNRLDSELKAWLIADTTRQPPLQTLRQQATDYAGPGAHVEKELQIIRQPAGFYCMILSNTTDRYVFYIYSGKFGSILGAVHGPLKSKDWTSGSVSDFLGGLEILSDNR
jgi:hypothetical protein